MSASTSCKNSLPYDCKIILPRSIDLVISGHNHGGQIVLPFLGGIYGGDQGWFPEYVHGMYEKDQIRLFVTSGLGTQKEKLPRFNNPPEIAVLTIK